MNEFEQKVWIALWGALAGGLMSLLVTLLSLVALPRLRRWNLTQHTSITTDLPHMGHARLRVVNGGFWTINDAQFPRFRIMGRQLLSAYWLNLFLCQRFEDESCVSGRL